MSDFLRNQDYCWFVEASNGEFRTDSFQETGEVWFFETEDPLDDKDWFTSINGDIYTGGIDGGIGQSMELPPPEHYADQYLVPPPPVPWSPPYIAHEDTTSSLPMFSLSDNEMDISHSDPTPGYYPESESTLFAENTSLTNVWPANYTGNPPADAISLPRSGEDCDDIFIHNAPSSRALEPSEAYEADVSCVQDGINNYGGDYRNLNPGVAVVYVTGSGELRFSSPFETSNDNYRVVFVTGPGVDVKIDWTLASPDPVDRGSLTPLIEAAFVASGTQSSPSTFEFEGRPGDPLDDPDSSIVVEGPIIGRSVILGRNRDIENYFPSEIIVYNNYYLYDLTNKERTEATGINNFTGLFVTDVDWISEE
jgi:hypothetical protein